MIDPLNDLKNELVKQGYVLSDFNIKITNDGATVEPKSSHFQRQITKEETGPLEVDNASLWYGNMVLGDVVTALGNDNAELWYVIMTGEM